MEYLLAGFVFAFCVLFIFAIATVFNREEKILKNRIDEYIKSDIQKYEAKKSIMSQQEKTEEMFNSSSESRPVKGKGYLNILRNIGSVITPEKVKEDLVRRLEEADVPLKETEFVAILFLLTCGVLLFSLMILKNIFIAAALSPVALLIPFMVLKIKTAKRVAAFNNQLLDNLVLISNSLKAGYSFLQAMDLVAREGKSPSKEEFGRVIRECALGKNVEESLNNLNKRIKSEDLDLTITVVNIQRQIGGNLAEILDKIQDTIRDRMKLKGDINTLTAQGRISGLIVGLLPVFLGIVLYMINPDYMMTLIKFKQGGFRGYYLLIFGGVLQLIGMYIIKEITTIEI